MNLINLNNITKKYIYGKNFTIAIDNLTLKIDEGELIAIIGTSGSGKSTLLNIIGGLDNFDSGNYIFKSQNINQNKLQKIRNKTFGYIIQNFALIKHYNIYDNIELPLIYSKVTLSERKNKVHNILKDFNLLDKKYLTPLDLSGGQQQQVAIARALINNPDIILADEPTGSLDTNNSEKIIDLLINLNRRGKTILIVTHDKYIAEKCNRIITISDGKITSDIKKNII